MFGKGLYFADMSSKSANYCYPTPRKNVGLVLLSEVCNHRSNIEKRNEFRSGRSWSIERITTR